MIARITGTIAHRGSGFVVLDAHGVGYKVFVTRDTLDALSKDATVLVTLWTHDAVREDAHDLYGFPDRESLEFFELLLSVSGIGPKTALAMLTVTPARTLRSAIASGDATHLTKTTGIGTKRAEKIIIELRDKLEELPGEVAAHKEEVDVIDALVSLGYSRRDAQETLKKVSKIGSAENKIKEALKVLGQKR